MNLSLHGKYALIERSSQGIGLASAQQLAKLGATFAQPPEIAAKIAFLAPTTVYLDVPVYSRRW